LQSKQAPRWATQPPPAQNPWQSASDEHTLRAHSPSVHSKFVGQSVVVVHFGSHSIVVVLQTWLAVQFWALTQEVTHVLQGPQMSPRGQSALLLHAGFCTEHFGQVSSGRAQ
jgi:hypothetical protein